MKNRFQSKTFKDTNVRRKTNILSRHLGKTSGTKTTPPAFSFVELNITELCNRKCSFCPRADPTVYPSRKEFMAIEVYKKIVTELKLLNFSGRLIFSAFSEPLLHQSLEKFIRLAKENSSDIQIELNTNGDLLTVGKLQGLFGAGLDLIVISMYDNQGQVQKFDEMMQKASIPTTNYILRARYDNPENKYNFILSNRSGMAKVPVDNKTSFPIKRPCYYPHYQIIVDWDGTVLLCPHDWGKKITIGNLSENSLLDTWTNNTIKRVRQSLASGDRDFPPCNRCNANGTLIGKRHCEQWQIYYNQE